MMDLLGLVLNGPPPPSNLRLYFERQREARRRRDRAGDRRSDRRTLADLMDGVSALPPLHRQRVGGGAAEKTKDSPLQGG